MSEQTVSLALIRHGPTAWNAVKRIQGSSDISLNEAGRAHIAALQVPTELQAFDWCVSPLSRARETAELLGHADARIDPALREMNWGEWEGQILKPLRRQLGDVMRNNEARGLDFRPPGGESPRDIQQRLQPWLRQLHAAGRDTCAVTHKGIIRCLFSLASGWDMVGECPLDFDWQQSYLWQINADGNLSPEHRTISLQAP